MGKEITLQNVQQHKKSNDLWLIIDKKVYDVTKFLNEHPGGEDALLSNAGVDATKAFNDVGHSSDARKLLEKYYIGDLANNDNNPRKYVIAIGAISFGVALVWLLKRVFGKKII